LILREKYRDMENAALHARKQWDNSKPENTKLRLKDDLTEIERRYTFLNVPGDVVPQLQNKIKNNSKLAYM